MSQVFFKTVKKSIDRSKASLIKLAFVTLIRFNFTSPRSECRRHSRRDIHLEHVTSALHNMLCKIRWTDVSIGIGPFVACIGFNQRLPLMPLVDAARCYVEGIKKHSHPLLFFLLFFFNYLFNFSLSFQLHTMVISDIYIAMYIYMRSVCRYAAHT